jgi:hypothetical protein
MRRKKPSYQNLQLTKIRRENFLWRVKDAYTPRSKAYASSNISIVVPRRVWQRYNTNVWLKSERKSTSKLCFLCSCPVENQARILREEQEARERLLRGPDLPQEEDPLNERNLSGKENRADGGRASKRHGHHKHGSDGHKHREKAHKHGEHGHKHGEHGHKHGEHGHKHGEHGHKHGERGQEAGDQVDEGVNEEHKRGEGGHKNRGHGHKHVESGHVGKDHVDEQGYQSGEDGYTQEEVSKTQEDVSNPGKQRTVGSERKTRFAVEADDQKRTPSPLGGAESAGMVPAGRKTPESAKRTGKSSMKKAAGRRRNDAVIPPGATAAEGVPLSGVSGTRSEGVSAEEQQKAQRVHWEKRKGAGNGGGEDEGEREEWNGAEEEDGTKSAEEKEGAVSADEEESDGEAFVSGSETGSWSEGDYSGSGSSAGEFLFMFFILLFLSLALALVCFYLSTNIMERPVLRLETHNQHTSFRVEE